MLQGGGGIDPRMTAREVVGLHARFHAGPRDVDEVLGAVGLARPATRTRYRRLSGGERQRVGLALALVGRPEVLILDEPTAGMDVEARRLTREVIRAERDAGAAILLTSHDLADVERLADRIAILDRGRIVGLGSPEELTGAGSPHLRLRLSSPVDTGDLAALGAELGVTVVDDGGTGRYRLSGRSPDPALIAALATWCANRELTIVELRAGAASLEERYLELTGATDAEDPR
jgi:ABC-2 type transport system ATP-binding protein